VFRVQKQGLLLVFGLCLASAARGEQITRVADIAPGALGGGASYLTVFNDTLYFRASDSVSGTELWQFDGATASVAADIRPGSGSSSPAFLAPYAGQLYFNAQGPAGGAPRLWRFDGTTAEQAPDPVGQNAQNPEDLIAYGGRLFYRAFRSGLGLELWKFDGTTQTPLDLFPGSGSSLPKEFIEYNGQLYMNVLNQELHRLNASQSGVVQVTNIGGGNGGSPEHPALFDGQIYFSANDFVHGRELWRFDGATAELAADIVPGGEFDSSSPTGLTAYDGGLYFSADNGVDGFELWRFDGTSATMVANVNATPMEPGVDPVHHSNPSDLVVFDGKLYFAADDGVHGRELWSYDGATARMVADIWPGPIGSEVASMTIYRDGLYFQANDGSTGSELTELRGEGLFRLEAVVPEPASVVLGALAGAAFVFVALRRTTGSR
jgi:ELWxxDGT repeat protein